MEDVTINSGNEFDLDPFSGKILLSGWKFPINLSDLLAEEGVSLAERAVLFAALKNVPAAERRRLLTNVVLYDCYLAGKSLNYHLRNDRGADVLDTVKQYLCGQSDVSALKKAHIAAINLFKTAGSRNEKKRSIRKVLWTISLTDDDDFLRTIIVRLKELDSSWARIVLRAAKRAL